MLRILKRLSRLGSPSREALDKSLSLTWIDRLEFIPLLEFCSPMKCAHTDAPMPDFDEYRKDSTKNPNVPARCSAEDRKISMYVPTLALGIVGLYAYKSHLLHYITFLAPSRDVMSASQTECKLTNVPEGKVATVKWRGKPIFVYHRSGETIEQERTTEVKELRDPEADEARVQRPEWLVVIGICTHLGCVPIPNAGMIPGGFYCPCHGSHYDAAGRIRKGPAPTNLEIPPYQFLDNETLLIG